MSEEESKTLRKIQSVAAKEFLKKGFMGSSLREIVKKAGVTTGAFYGYYKSKEELFDSLVKDSAKFILKMTNDSLSDFTSLSDEEQEKSMYAYAENNVTVLLDYIFAHKTEVTLLFKSAEGTNYGNFIDKLAAIEEKSTKDFIAVLAKKNPDVAKIEPLTIKILSKELVSTLIEPLLQDAPIENARESIIQIQRFFEYGWGSLMGLEG